MSQQNDDEGTVIRPTTTSTGAPGVASPPARTQTTRPSDSAEDNLSLQVGAHVAEFEITRRIGEGGFSIVYLAMDHSLDRTVALKEYMPSSLAARVGTTLVQPRSQRHRDTFEAGLKSFVNEAKLLAQFDHPSLVKVYRFWEANGTAYMVMPYYQGVTVKDAVRAMREPPDEEWLLTLLGPLTEALLVIHAEHCYHRDIAPDNVILLANSAKPLLLDFGAARRVIGDMTQGLTVILKSGYAPVEQYAEIPGMKQGSWTDVYALAAVVYWAVTGSTPPASVGRMLSDSFVPLSQCAAGRYSERFLQAVDRALIVHPEHRTPSIAAFREDLGLNGEGTAATPSAVRWNDPEATIIRPSARASVRTATQQSRTDTFSSAARAAQPMPTAPFAPATTGERQREDLSEEAQPAPSLVPVSTPAKSTPDEKRTGPRRGLLIASVGIAVVIATAGGWWALQPSKDASSNPVPTATAPSALDRLPAVNSGSAEARDTTEPSVATQPLPSATEPTLVAPTPPAAPTEPSASTSRAITANAPAEPPPSIPTETVVAVPPTPLPSVERVPEAAAPRSTRRTSAAANQTAPGELRTERTSRPPAAPKDERSTASSADEAECVRIFQRLSLGESNPALLNRLKTLKCR